MNPVVTVRVVLGRERSNEAPYPDWVPTAADVAEEIETLFQGRDLDTGWVIMGVSP